MSIPGPHLHWAIAAEGRAIVLPDGACAVVRTLANGEAAAVREVFDGMSERSRYARFGGAKPILSRRELDRLTAIDHDDHEVLVALDPETGRAVAEAHLVRDKTNRGVGEVAFAVADAWQGRCLGSRLAELLASRARELGIHRLRAHMLSDNSRSRALMRRMGRVAAHRYERGALEVEVALD